LGSGTLGFLNVQGPAQVIKVECYPLAFILAAANVDTLDFLSLDVQGAEMNILKTLPWDIIDIDVC
jgi:FkbM family methyltransferase